MKDKKEKLVNIIIIISILIVIILSILMIIYYKNDNKALNKQIIININTHNS